MNMNENCDPGVKFEACPVCMMPKIGGTATAFMACRCVDFSPEYRVERDCDSNEVRVFKSSDCAFHALTGAMMDDGWRICNFGGYENAIVKLKG